MPSPETELVLDFTDGGTLPPALLRRLNALATEKRKDFNGLIDRLSAGHGRNIDWWVSLPASRNTHAGQLFGKCMQLSLVRALADEGKSFSLQTDDPVLAKSIFRATVSMAAAFASDTILACTKALMLANVRACFTCRFSIAFVPIAHCLRNCAPRVPVQAAFREVPGAIFVEGSFTDALAQADMVAGLGTNTLIEAAAMGVPVICVCGGNMPAELPFTAHDTVWWRAAYDADELVAAIRKAPACAAPSRDLLAPAGAVRSRDFVADFAALTLFCPPLDRGAVCVM